MEQKNIEYKKGNKLLPQVVRFILGGFITVIADYATFYVIFVVSSNLALAVVGSMIAGMTASFILNKTWVFGTGSQSRIDTVRQLILYTLLAGANTGFTYWFVGWAMSVGFNVYAAKLVAIAFVVGWSFVLYRTVIFRSKA